LLEEFLQSDRWILERVDDSAGCIGTAYRRACQLFARAAPGVASPAALAKRIALLVEKGGQRAEEHVTSDSIIGLVVDRPYFELHGLETAERLLDQAQLFVGGDYLAR